MRCGRFVEIDGIQQLGFEPDSFDLGLWLRHEFTNCLEDDPKLAVVFLFQFIKPPRESLVRTDHLSKLNERSHDGNVHLNPYYS